jgi:hypothetical protein
MKTEKVYINLLVYDYDASPRQRFVRHVCGNEKKARTLEDRLGKLIGPTRSDNKTTRWLEQHTGIYGFVERVDGIYKEVTTRL